MLDNTISELTRKDLDINLAKIKISKQELWAKKDKNDTNIKSSGLNVSYLPQDGNNVQWLLDGREAMFEMCDAFIRATKFIYVIASFFSPGINLVRGEEDYNKMYNKSALHKKIMDEVNNLNKTKQNITEKTVPLISLLAVKAQNKDDPVPVRIVMFHPSSVQKGTFGSEEAFKMVRTWSNKIDIRLAMWGSNFEGHEIGVHHQKSVVVGTDEGLIGFCGGMDFAFGRWTKSEHDLDKILDTPDTVDPPFRIDTQMSWISDKNVMGEYIWDKKKEKGSYICKPGNEWFGEGCEEGSQVLWHDVHAKVVGPVAYDLALNFSRRYEKADTNYSIQFPPKEDLKNEIEQYKNKFASLSSEEGYSRGKVWAQILRSYSPDEDYGIWDAYRNLFSKAKKSIYIENQYAFEDGEVLKVLIDNIENKKKSNKEFRVIVVAPVMPDHYDTEIRKNLAKLIKTNRDKIAAYSLVSTSGERRIPIYVHAKIAVVDDEWSVVGSANLDRFGMGGATSKQPRGSSEMAILVHGKEQALALRNMLAREHLGYGAPANLDDFNIVFDAFKNVAAKNGLPKDKGPIIGHLVKHRVYEDIDSHDSGGLRSLIFHYFKRIFS
jgi:phosphatidylserine/phosphatidylglycerophosphate/cardiolipin synthase-like enzyme